MATVDRCGRCGRPHVTDLPCWRGSYCARITKTVLDLMGTVCWVCGRDIATTADHIKPRGQGGTDALDNLRPACVSCNSRRAHDDNPFGEDDPVPPTVPVSGRWAT